MLHEVHPLSDFTWLDLLPDPFGYILVSKRGMFRCNGQFFYNIPLKITAVRQCFFRLRIFMIGEVRSAEFLSNNCPDVGNNESLVQIGHGTNERLNSPPVKFFLCNERGDQKVKVILMICSFQHQY